LLILAVFLCVPPYWKMSNGPHQPSNDPLPDLGNFVEGQGAIDRRMILKETASAAIRVLTDENFNRWFEKPRQTEHKYLSTVLMHAVGKSQPMLGCLEGTLDRYCKARIVGPLGHAEAFRISWVLAPAKLPHGMTTQVIIRGQEDSKAGFSCSRTTSSATLKGSICDTTSGSCKAQKAHVKFGLVVKAGKKQISDTPDHVFTIQFVGKRGVGKSGIINRVTRASPRPKYITIVKSSSSRSPASPDRFRVCILIRWNLAPGPCLNDG
jgi:hypothetical protein